MNNALRIIARLLPYASVLFLFVVVRNDPFFGDSISTVSRAAVTIYNSNFSNIAYPEYADPGHPLLVPALLAFMWKLFGMHLWVGHALSLVFSLLLLMATEWYAGNFLNKNIQWLPILILGSGAGFISQSALVLTHIPLALFFILSLHAIEKESHYEYGLFTVLMLLTHLQGIVLWSFSALVLFLKYRKKWKKLAEWVLPNLMACFALFLWLGFHFLKTGWWISSPDYQRAPADFSVFAYNVAISIWRITDYGYFIVFFPILFYIKKLYHLRIFIIMVLGYTLLIAFLSYTITFSVAHRYFLPLLPILAIVCVSAISHSKHKLMWMFVIVLFIVSGQFLYYPGKVMGDTTLHYRHYFKLEQEIKKDWEGYWIYSYAPICNESLYTHLDSTSGLGMVPLYDNTITDAEVVAYSNLNGEFTSLQLDTLKTWQQRTYSSGPLWVTIFVNPDTKTENQVWNKREKDKWEIRVENWKKRLKP